MAKLSPGAYVNKLSSALLMIPAIEERGGGQTTQLNTEFRGEVELSVRVDTQLHMQQSLLMNHLPREGIRICMNDIGEQLIACIWMNNIGEQLIAISIHIIMHERYWGTADYNKHTYMHERYWRTAVAISIRICMNDIGEQLIACICMNDIGEQLIARICMNDNGEQLIAMSMQALSTVL